MFKTYPNHTEINNLNQMLTPIFEFNTFNENNTYVDKKDYGSTIYTMADNNGWACVTSFVNKEKKLLSKNTIVQKLLSSKKINTIEVMKLIFKS